MKTLLLLLALALPTFAQETGPEPSPAPSPQVAVEPPIRLMIESFFNGLRDKEVDRAYDQLTKFSPIAEKAEDVKLLKSKTREAIETFGAISGGEIVASQSVGTHLLRTTAVSLGGRYPLRWRFYFYRATDTWRLIDIRVDDRLAGMFNEEDSSTIGAPK